MVKSSNYKVQSVIFDKSQWTVAQAKAWLKRHKFKNNNVDMKPLHIRFRQVSPTTLKNKGFKKYRTLELGQGIALIIAYK